MAVTTTINDTTYVRGGKKVARSRTFEHVPMETENGVVCRHCRIVQNGDLSCVPWPCAFVMLEDATVRAAMLDENLLRVQGHLQHMAIQRLILIEAIQIFRDARCRYSVDEVHHFARDWHAFERVVDTALDGQQGGGE